MPFWLRLKAFGLAVADKEPIDLGTAGVRVPRISVDLLDGGGTFLKTNSQVAASFALRSKTTVVLAIAAETTIRMLKAETDATSGDFNFAFITHAP